MQNMNEYDVFSSSNILREAWRLAFGQRRHIQLGKCWVRPLKPLLWAQIVAMVLGLEYPTLSRSLNSQASKHSGSEIQLRRGSPEGLRPETPGVALASSPRTARSLRTSPPACFDHRLRSATVQPRSPSPGAGAKEQRTGASDARGR